jgi:hypothetical protein
MTDAEIQSDHPDLLELLKQTAQRCPTCKLWIERSDGCDHMVCSCGVAFCYVCGEEYSACSCRHDVYIYGYGGRYHDNDDDVAGERVRWLHEDACARCGCTAEIDDDGERVCFCDTCREHGCEHHVDADRRYDDPEGAWPHTPLISRGQTCLLLSRGHASTHTQTRSRRRMYRYHDDDYDVVAGGGNADEHVLPWPRDRFCSCCNSDAAVAAELERSLLQHGAPTGCALCGCSRDRSDDGARVCHCDTCCEHGCVVAH